MKAVVRKVGNSLGVLIPRAIAESWGVREGDMLQIDDKGLWPMPRGPVGQQALDVLKRQIAGEVLAQFPLGVIREKSLANLARWKKSGAWCEAYDTWFALLKNPDDGRLYKAMLGMDDEANRLRQSMPFVGLLPAQTLRKLREKAAA